MSRENQMPYSLLQNLKKLFNKLQLTYGDYAAYTETLDELHTLIINDAQRFKPKRKRKNVQGFSDAHKKATESHRARKEKHHDDSVHSDD